MAKVKQNFDASVNLTLFDSTDGSPLTGLTAADVTPIYYVKEDQSTPTSKTLDSTNFREIDSTNMPGLYQIDFTSGELDTLGNFTVTVPANGGVNLEQKNFELEVEENSNKTFGGKGVVNAWKGKFKDITVPIFAKGTPLETTDANSFRQRVPWYATKITASRSDGSSIVLDGTVSTDDYNFGEWGTSAWKEINPTTSPGMYTLSTGVGNSSNGLTDVVGDVTIDIEPSLEPVWDIYQSDVVPEGSGPIGEVAFLNTTEGYAVGAATGIYKTTDGGLTWTLEQTTVGQMYAIDVIDNGGTTEIYVGGEIDGNRGARPEVWFYDGTTWNDLTNTLGADIGVGEYVYGISIVSPTEIWYGVAPSDNGHVAGSYTGGTGGTWTSFLRATSAPSAVDIAAYDVGGTTYISLPLEGGSIQFSNNDGVGWSDVGPATSDDFTAISFPDSTNGWAITANGIYNSTDSGASWALQTSDVVSDSLFMYDANVGITTNQRTSYPRKAAITTDGGTTWTEQTIYPESLQYDSGIQDGIQQVIGDSISLGWSPDGTNFYASGDQAVAIRRGIENFNPRTIHLNVQEDYLGPNWDENQNSLEDLRYVSNEIYRRTTSDIEVQKDSTANITLEFVREGFLSPNPNIAANQVSVTAIKNGTVLSSNPVTNITYRGTNSGQRYEVEIDGSTFDTLGDYFLVFDKAPVWQYTAWADQAVAADFVNGAAVCTVPQGNDEEIRIVGQNGRVYSKLYDDTFEDQPTPISENLNDIDGYEEFFAAYFDFAVGQNGSIIYKNYDIDGSWIDVSDAETDNYVSVAAVYEGSSDPVAFVVGSTLSDIRKYNHSTTSWSNITDPSGEGATWTSIEEGNGILMLGGLGSKLYKSSDNGSTWDKIDIFTTEFVDVEKIFYITGDWVVITSNGVYISEDDGASWLRSDPSAIIEWAHKDEGNDLRLFGQNNIFVFDGNTFSEEPVSESLESVDSRTMYTAYDDIVIGNLNVSGTQGFYQYIGEEDFESFVVRVRVVQPPTKPDKSFQ